MIFNAIQFSLIQPTMNLHVLLTCSEPGCMSWSGVVCKHLLVCEGDLEGTVLLGPLAGPILLTLLLPPLQNIGYHGNYRNPLLLYQPPHVSDGVWEGAYKRFEILMDM